MNIGIIGLGYFGKNYAKILSNITNVNLIYCCDHNKSNLTYISKFTKNVKLITDYKTIISDKNIDTVFIITKPENHFKLILDSLNSNKNVFVEKPLCLNYNDALILTQISEIKKLTLMVGYTYLYDKQIIKLKNILKKEQIISLNSIRLGMNTYNSDNVLWELAVHDISILIYLFDMPTSLLCTNINGLLLLELMFKNNFVCLCSVSWQYYKKIRTIIINTAKKRIELDTINHILKIDSKENKRTIIRNNFNTLKEEISFFIKLIKNGDNTKSLNDFTLKVTKLLWIAEKSLKRKKRIKINEIF